MDHEYNRTGSRASYSLNCDDETIAKLDELDSKAESEISSLSIFDPSAWKHMGAVNRKNEKWPKVSSRYSEE